MKNEVTAVNVAGYINSEFGLGEGVRSTIRALEAARVEFVLNNFASDKIHRRADASYADFSTKNPFPVNIIHINGNRVKDFIDEAGGNYFNKKYNIGFWAWELPDFPSEWLASLNLFDEIWTPSNYSAESIALAAAVPVIKIPHSIAPVPSSATVRSQFGLPDDKFIFLFVFDFCSVYERKNPVGLLTAFLKAFDNRKDVLLVVKSSNAAAAPQESAALKKAAKGAANVVLIDLYLDKKDLDGLINECDCYVSLHRSEGFGLTVAEAMFFGKPVIATDYSATAEFLNVSNGFPVKFDSEILTKDYGHYRQGSQWANPSVEHAAELMRYVFENREKSAAVGVKAAADARTLFSPAAIGDKMAQRLERIKYLKNDFADVAAEKTRPKLDSMRVAIEQKDEEIRSLQNRIRRMKDSRFWKIRNQWFGIKRTIGIADDKSANLD